MTDIQASLGVVQLKKLEEFIKLREKYAMIYNKAFSGMEEITIPTVFLKNNRHSWHLYTILLNKKKLKISRNQFIEELKKAKIGTSVHFIPLHLHPFYQKTFRYHKGDFPIAEDIYKRIVSLPLYPKMTKIDIYYVISSVKDIISRYRR